MHQYSTIWTHAIPRIWKQIIHENADLLMGTIIPIRGILQCTRIIPLETLVSKQIYILLIRKCDHTPTSKRLYTERFSDIHPKNWLNIYMVPSKITQNAYERNFQYIILNNILYLNDKLFQFGKTDTNQCSFCSN